MDRNILIFIFILVILFIGHVFLNESFIGQTPTAPTTASPSAPTTVTSSVPTSVTIPVSAGTSQTSVVTVPYSSSIDIPYTITKPAVNCPSPAPSPASTQMNDSSDLNYADDDSNIMTDSCIDSISADQGADFMRYIPGKNPADYIRKDSIPCYKCSIP